MFDLEEVGNKKVVEVSDQALLNASKSSVEDEIAKRATSFARYAMADVEYALAVLGKSLSKEEYQQCFNAMMVRKAKNEVRKHNS